MQMQESRTSSVRGRLALPPRSGFTFCCSGRTGVQISSIAFAASAAALLATFRLSTEETL